MEYIDLLIYMSFKRELSILYLYNACIYTYVNTFCSDKGNHKTSHDTRINMLCLFIKFYRIVLAKKYKKHYFVTFQTQKKPKNSFIFPM